ncbi:MAG: hypothetical protein MUE40_01775 [Anaerolineae bacterium]|nr:hypothetical protein [Anaerolineae bacterium]
MNLARALVAYGLLEAGLFTQGEQVLPLRLRLELLPAAPALLAHIAELALPLVGPVERLVCLPDALPLGVAISLKSGLPLVYSRGRGESPVLDLVGSYDVGHPALLLMNTPPAVATLLEMQRRAATVGLEIGRGLALLAPAAAPGEDSPLPVVPLLTLAQVVADLQQMDWLTAGQAQAIQRSAGPIFAG